MTALHISSTVFGKFKDDESCLLVGKYNVDYKFIATWRISFLKVLEPIKYRSPLGSWSSILCIHLLTDGKWKFLTILVVKI